MLLPPVDFSRTPCWIFSTCFRTIQLQHVFFTGCKLFQGICAYCDMSFSMGCRWTICLTMVFSRGCMRISALEPGAHPLAPCSLALCLQSSLSHCCSFFCCGGSVRAFCFLPSPSPCPPSCPS